MIIEVDTKQEEGLLEEALNKEKRVTDQFEIGKPKKRDPQIVIHNVDEEMEGPETECHSEAK